MKTYRRAVIFTKAPLGGYYRFKDIFQIFPANFQGMPENPYKKHYPNILEYWFAEEEKVIKTSEYENLNELFTLTATTYTKEDKIISLLNAFTNNIFFKYGSFEEMWTIPILIDEDTQKVSEEMNNLSPQWSIPMYHYPGLPDQLKINEFTKLTSKEVRKLPHQLFYIYNPSLDNDNKTEIIFPSSMDMILESYYSQNKEINSILSAAIGYIVCAVELLTTKRTLALLAAFTALETMVNLDYLRQETDTCGTCGQLKFSVAKKFREYLLRYVGDSESNKKKFNSYYRLRSKIVHTGERLKSETLFSEFSKEELGNEFIARIEILQLTKIAIANWLIKNNIEKDK